MNRPRHTWLLFGGCLTLLLVGLVWLSLTALRLDLTDEPFMTRLAALFK